jgi:hypothetical protein
MVAGVGVQIAEQNLSGHFLSIPSVPAGNAAPGTETRSVVSVVRRGCPVPSVGILVEAMYASAAMAYSNETSAAHASSSGYVGKVTVTQKSASAWAALVASGYIKYTERKITLLGTLSIRRLRMGS